MGAHGFHNTKFGDYDMCKGGGAGLVAAVTPVISDVRPPTTGSTPVELCLVGLESCVVRGQKGRCHALASPSPSYSPLRVSPTPNLGLLMILTLYIRKWQK